VSDGQGIVDTVSVSARERQFEDDDGGVCYIETHDHDTYTGHFPLRLLEFTPARLGIRNRQNKPQLRRSDVRAGREAF
jgi:hypothetical protein